MNDETLAAWKAMADNPSWWEIEDKGIIAGIVVAEATEAIRLRSELEQLQQELADVLEIAIDRGEEWNYDDRDYIDRLRELRSDSRIFVQAQP